MSAAGQTGAVRVLKTDMSISLWLEVGVLNTPFHTKGEERGTNNGENTDDDDSQIHL